MVFLVLLAPLGALALLVVMARLERWQETVASPGQAVAVQADSIASLTARTRDPLAAGT